MQRLAPENSSIIAKATLIDAAGMNSLFETKRFEKKAGASRLGRWLRTNGMSRFQTLFPPAFTTPASK